MNEVTRGNYPRKADEYLAMEKPLVATATEGMKMFEPYCFLCNTKEEYAEKISTSLTNPEMANSSNKTATKRVCFIPYLGRKHWHAGRCLLFS